MMQENDGLEQAEELGSGAPQAPEPENVKSWHNILRHLKLIPETLESRHVQLSDKEIIISGLPVDNMEKIKEQIDQGLVTPEKILSSLGVTLHPGEQDDHAGPSAAYHVEPMGNIPLPPQDGDGLATLERFLGEKLELFPGISVAWGEKFREGPVLLSINVIGDVEKTIWTRWVKSTAERISKMPLHHLRKIYQGDESIMQDPPQQDGSIKIHAVDPDLFKRCFGFIEKEGKRRLFCDYNLMHQLLYPPQSNLLAGGVEGECSLRLDKAHLIAYMRQVFSEGVVMQLVEGHDDQANPVLLPSPFSQVVTPTIVLMVDVSGSMGAQLEEYKIKLKQMVGEICNKCASDEASLIIVPFSDNTELKLEKFNLTETGPIGAYIDSLVCNGRTRMYGTMADLMEHEVIQGNDAHQNNVNVILATDGQDNYGTSKYQNSLMEKFNKPGYVAPQMFTLGLGNDHDANLCSEFARITGGTYQPLEDASKLDALYAHIENVVNPRTLEVIKRQINGAIKEQFVSVYGDPVALTQTVIAPGESFSVNGRELYFKAGGPGFEEYVAIVSSQADAASDSGQEEIAEQNQQPKPEEESTWPQYFMAKAVAAGNTIWSVLPSLRPGAAGTPSVSNDGEAQAKKMQ